MMSAASPTGPQGDLWAIVLAGGEDARLRPLIQRLYGEFPALSGVRSLLRQTLDRVRMVAASDRTVVVTLRNLEGYLHEALEGAAVRRVLVQPADKGSAAGVLLPCHWIHRSDPEAIVAVFPSGHFIGEEDLFMDHVADIVDVVREHPEWIVLMGASPSHPEPDYGWIEPGEVVGWTPVGNPVSRVNRFWEKPSLLAARACLEKGWLWNTFVFVARARTLLEVGGQFLAGLSDQLSVIFPCEDKERESRALHQVYGLAHKSSFSRSVLELCPPSLVVSRLPAISWSDWGTQERVLKSLRKVGLLPVWFGESDLRREPDLAILDPIGGARLISEGREP